MIGVKAWLYKGEILDAGNRMKSLSSEPEPRRDRAERGDRRDRGGDRGGDRGDRRPPVTRHHEPAAAPVAAEPSGAARQAAPTEMAHPARSGGPILPPLMAPQPAWKQEVRPDTEPQAELPAPPTGTPEGETKP